MSTPLVTALIDTYNHQLFIEDAINSVLRQDFPASEIEIVVVDDGSTDRTPEIVRGFEPRVRLIRKPNGGQGSAFNTGIPECRGEIIAFLDGDDWWVPGKLAKVLAVFDRHPEIGMVGHGTIAFYEDGKRHTEILKEAARFSLNSMEGVEMFRVRKNFLGTRTTVRASVLRRLLPVPEVIRIEADEFVFTMAAAFAEVYILPEALFHYRIHGNNQFSLTGFDKNRIRHKQQSLAHLAEHLTTRLRAAGVGEEIVRGVVQDVQVEADQLRLSVDGGFPWETVSTELRIMRLFYSDASIWQHLFSCVRLIPAVILPASTYYRWRRWLSLLAFYQKFRQKFLPFPVPSHVERREKLAP